MQVIEIGEYIMKVTAHAEMCVASGNCGFVAPNPDEGPVIGTKSVVLRQGFPLVPHPG